MAPARRTSTPRSTATAPAAPFRGWTGEVFDFYVELAADNTKAFWAEHKAFYETQVRDPFLALSAMIEDEIGPLRVHRPYRDTRFSKDKTPYKLACSAITEGEGGETYYLEVSAGGLVVGSGYWMMLPDQLARYREAVDDTRAGAALEKAVAAVRAKKLVVPEHHALKTAPRGYPRDHPRIELLRMTSMAAMRSWEPAAWMHTKGAAGRILTVWRDAAPLHAWCNRHIGPTTEPPPDRW